MRILVRSPNWIGDQILAYPFFHYLRKVFPKAWIASSCVPWVSAIQYRNLVNEVIALPTPLDSRFRSKWNAAEAGARILKDAGPWDFGISLTNSISSAWQQFRAGVKVRRGYNVDGRGFLLNQSIPWPEKAVLHRSEAYVKLVTELKLAPGSVQKFWGLPAENELDEGIPGELADFDAEKAWPDADPLDPPATPYWVLAPGSTAESRRWQADQFAVLAERVFKETGWKGIIVGGGAESKSAHRLVESSGGTLIDLTARGSVASYWKLLRGAKFSVCNDSGLAHVAALCGSPVHIIWGGGDPRRTEPLGPGSVKFSMNPVDCWPCEKNQCLQPPGKKLECLKGIHPDAVWNEIKNGLRPK